MSQKILVPYRCGECGQGDTDVVFGLPKLSKCPCCESTRIVPLAIIHFVREPREGEKPELGPSKILQQLPTHPGTQTAPQSNKLGCAVAGCATCHRTSVLAYVTCANCLRNEQHTYDETTHRFNPAPSPAELVNT